MLFDRRGTGVSDPLPGTGTPFFEQSSDDLIAVLDAAGIERAAIIGCDGGGPVALVAAATYPDRVSALVLVNTFARMKRSDDYPAGVPAHDPALFVRVQHDASRIDRQCDKCKQYRQQESSQHDDYASPLLPTARRSPGSSQVVTTHGVPSGYPSFSTRAVARGLLRERPHRGGEPRLGTLRGGAVAVHRLPPRRGPS